MRGGGEEDGKGSLAADHPTHAQVVLASHENVLRGSSRVPSPRSPTEERLRVRLRYSNTGLYGLRDLT